MPDWGPPSPPPWPGYAPQPAPHPPQSPMVDRAWALEQVITAELRNLAQRVATIERRQEAGDERKNGFQKRLNEGDAARLKQGEALTQALGKLETLTRLHSRMEARLRRVEQGMKTLRWLREKGIKWGQYALSLPFLWLLATNRITPENLAAWMSAFGHLFGAVAAAR